MSRLTAAIQRAIGQGRLAVIPYVTAGDPAFGATDDLIVALAAAGADIIEIGVPFSDPLADGPTIQRSCCRALANGTKLGHALDAVARARTRGVDVPIALLTYYNCVLRKGEREFVLDAAAAGADGVIVPDLPPEEAETLRFHAAEAGLDVVPLAAPTSTDERLRFIGRVASGFIYCVSVTGVTGARDALPETLPAFVQRVRRWSGGLPVAVGFGVSTPRQARAIGAYADGVIVGSALLERMERVGAAAAATAAAAFVGELRNEMSGCHARVV